MNETIILKSEIDEEKRLNFQNLKEIQFCNYQMKIYHYYCMQI